MTFEEIEARLKALRIIPLTLEIPFPQAGRHVHFYLVEDSRPALFDTGLYSEANEKYIAKALARHGYALTDMRRVFLTHGHIDHYGNARLFQAHGAEIYLHPADAPKVTRGPEDRSAMLRELYACEFMKHGFPASLTEHLETIFLAARNFAQTIEPPTPVHDGDRFVFDRFDVHAVTVPGHTPGCVAYFFGDTGVAITGDHLLQSISPNPLFEINLAGKKFPSLPTYFASLRKILTSGLCLALPAHGPFITDAAGLAHSLAAFYERRQRKIFRMIERPAQAFELCQTYYRRLKDFEVFLGFSEILGNLDMMQQRGEVVLEERNGRYFYARATEEPLPFGL